MKSLRVALGCLVLVASVAATQVSAASGPDASAAKKCKKPYVKKRGKCKFTPKQGLYKSKDGSVSLTLKTIVGGKYVNLFRGGPATLKCRGREHTSGVRRGQRGAGAAQEDLVQDR